MTKIIYYVCDEKEKEVLVIDLRLTCNKCCTCSDKEILPVTQKTSSPCKYVDLIKCFFHDNTVCPNYISIAFAYIPLLIRIF